MADLHPALQAFIDAANAAIDCARELERLRGVEAKKRAEWVKVRTEEQTEEKAA